MCDNFKAIRGKIFLVSKNMGENSKYVEAIYSFGILKLFNYLNIILF